MNNSIRSLIFISIGLASGCTAWAAIKLDITGVVNNQIELEVSWPHGFTDDLEIYACGNPAVADWRVVSERLPTIGNSSLTWLDADSPSYRRRYYYAGVANVDADNDGIDDTWEALHDLNNNYFDANFDADGDKLTNLEEYTIGSNPQSAADANGNGIPDDWEAWHNMQGGASADPDNDGFTNAEEFYYGTDPNVSILDAYGLVRYTDAVYSNNLYCYSVADPSPDYSGDNCLQMWIKNNDHYQSVFRFGTDSSIINKPGYYLKFNIRADRVLSASYPLQLQLIWSDNVATLDIMPHLYVDADCTIPATSISTQYLTCMVPVPDTLSEFRDFQLMYNIEVGSVQEAIFYVDNIAIMNGIGADIEAAEVLDSKHIMITASQKFNLYSARDVNSHRLETLAGIPLELERVGVRSWVTGFENNSPVVKHYLYLELADGGSLQSGQTYTYTCHARNEWLVEPDRATINVSYNDQTDISSSIKINQVGYLPQSRKYCYIGNYLGDAGEMPVTPTDVYLRNQWGAVVGTWPMSRVSKPDLFNVAQDELKPFCGEEVWVADFSAFTTPGKYYIQVPGMGRSYEFEIANDVYNPVYYHTARAFYYQRSGVEIEAQYAGQWARPASHTASAYYHNSVADKSPALYDSSVEPAVGGAINVTGGWYDAADYNKYTQSGAEAVNYILSLYELAPEKYACDDLNIPESGNGIPDIIDQARWELDWLAKMVSANGAVFNKCSFPDFAQVMPQDRTKDMWVITKTTRDTALACAVLAKASRIFTENGWYPLVAYHYGQKAQLAWQCLENNPQSYPLAQGGESYDAYQNPDGDGGSIPNVRTGPYYQSASDANDAEERIWAALEIYNLTGSQEVYNRFVELVDEISANDFATDLENMMVGDWYSAPCNIMALYPVRDLDSDCAASVSNAVGRIMNAYQKGLDTWRYQTAMKNTLTSSNFGGLSMSSRWSIYYILFYELVGDPEMLTLAKQNLDFQLGANPLSTTYITGIGEKHPEHPHLKITEYDGIAEVIPGYSVYGVAHSLPLKGYYADIMDNCYPIYQGTDPASQYYPTARKFVDAFEPVKMGEFVIDNLARTAMAFGYFSDPDAVYQP